MEGAALEPQSILNFTQWFGAVAFGLLSLFGVGKLLEMTLGRFFRKRDDKGVIHETNQGKQIDSADKDKDRQDARINKLETDIEKLRTDQLAMAIDNASLKIENANLTKENLKQAGDIRELQETVHRLEIDIAGTTAVRAELEKTKAMLIACESREPLVIETATLLRKEAMSIYENVNEIDFAPTSDPISPKDKGYVRRLKEMKISAKRMQEAI